MPFDPKGMINKHCLHQLDMQPPFALAGALALLHFLALGLFALRSLTLNG